MKIRLVVAELFDADGRSDGQTDTTKLMVALRHFAKAPKNIRGFAHDVHIHRPKLAAAACIKEYKKQVPWRMGTFCESTDRMSRSGGIEEEISEKTTVARAIIYLSYPK
jgi:hypothetical protein